MLICYSFLPPNTIINFTPQSSFFFPPQSLLAKYAGHLLERNRTVDAIELYKKVGGDIRKWGETHWLEWWDVVLQKRLAWALFVLLLSTLVCCQPTELIWGFLFRKFSYFTPPPPQAGRHGDAAVLLFTLADQSNANGEPSLFCKKGGGLEEMKRQIGQ